MVSPLRSPRGRALLLVNKRNRKIAIRLKQEWKDAAVSVVDSSEAPRTNGLEGTTIELAPFAVAAVHAR